MSSPRGARAKCPDRTSSKAQARVSGESQEQRDPNNSKKKHKPTESPADTSNGSAPTRRSGSGQRKTQTDTSESKDKAATRQADINQQSKKDRKREDESSQPDDRRTTEEKNRRARKSAPVSDTHATGSDAQKSAKSDTRSKQKKASKCESQAQSATKETDKKPTSRRANGDQQSRKQKDLPDTDSVREDASAELSNSTSQDKRGTKLTKKQSSNSTESTEHQGSVNDLDKVLQATLDKLKIKTSERSNAASCVNTIRDEVISHLKRNMSWCKDIESLPTGSYYENVKICEPDEFDVMLTVPVERVDIQPHNDNGAFYSIALKRHPKHPLDKFLNEDKTIQASEMLKEFRDGVKEAVESLKYEIKVQRKKQKSPAVTLEVNENGSVISIDFVLGLKVHGSWPIYTKDGFKIETWLGTKEKMDLKRQPYYLVPKYEGKGNVEHDGLVAKDAWRISFSHIEKEILKRHGHSKTCCEAQGKKCSRKECLKLLKYLLSQLKKKHPDKMSKFCSYHAKTTLLHACATKVEDSEWAFSQLTNCFLQLLDDFVRVLREQVLCNFFVPSQNLLHSDNLPKSNCEFLAKQIETQRDNNFPIFQ